MILRSKTPHSLIGKWALDQLKIVNSEQDVFEFIEPMLV
jgi:hypothetical protein